MKVGGGYKKTFMEALRPPGIAPRAIAVVDDWRGGRAARLRRPVAGPFARELIASVNGTDAYAMVEKAVGLRRKRNTDQPALDLGAARLLVEDGVEVGALPTNYNFKIAPCDPHHDARRQEIGAAHLVRGPVRLIHHKNLKHPHTLRKLVNAAASATRVVVGATACAMHDPNQIRVHEMATARGSPTD